MVLLPVLSACTSLISTPEPQDPNEYLENALNWIQTHAVFGDRVDWEVLRRQALVYANNPRTTADTYPAIRYVLGHIFDDNSGFTEPQAITPDQDNYIGIRFYSPNHLVLYVDPNSPADKAGVRVGDIGLSYEEVPTESTVRLTVERVGQARTIHFVLDKISPPENAYQPEPTGRKVYANPDWVGYVELTPNSGSPTYPGTYPGRVHHIIQKLDRTPVCGWIIDLRRNDWGDIWSYLAALGPIMGEGDVGGFLYPDNTRELWSYRDGKVFWANNERYESLVEGGIYTPKRKMPPVALLTSHATTAAGELVIVAFQGREKVHTFGEHTRGLPMLIVQTALSDGVQLVMSGAYATDRKGASYQGPIYPDENISTDWSQFGTDQDPVILAALDWLNTQPECGN
jgi:C-terminal processing protease CtpA/Prc